MSQQFLDQILTMENVIAAPRVALLLQVRSGSDHLCCICLQEIGTLSPETGIIECEIRLPCSHLIGSACIATWLRSNNTCPLCRQAFFPAQPQANLGYDHMLAMSSEEEEEEEDATFICKIFCQALGFSYQAIEAAQDMSELLEDIFELPDHSPQCIAATTAYIISHIMGQAASIADISDVSGIHVELIRSSYRIVHPNREKLILPQMPRELGREYIEGILALLPALRPEDGFIDVEGVNEKKNDGSDLEYHLIPPRNGHLGELCDRCGTRLGYEPNAIWMSQSFAWKISLGFFLPGHSPLPIVALSLYMVNYLMGLQRFCWQISDVVGVSEGTIRDSYRRVYRHRRQLVGIQTLGCIRLRNVVRVVRALHWPAL